VIKLLGNDARIDPLGCLYFWNKKRPVSVIADQSSGLQTRHATMWRCMVRTLKKLFELYNNNFSRRYGRPFEGVIDGQRGRCRGYEMGHPAHRASGREGCLIGRKALFHGVFVALNAA
jgi:hypothetical protein